MTDIISPCLKVNAGSSGVPLTLTPSSDACCDDKTALSGTTESDGTFTFECLKCDKYDLNACASTIDGINMIPRSSESDCDDFVYSSADKTYTKTIEVSCTPAVAPLSVTLAYDLGNLNGGTPISNTITYGVYSENIRIWEYDDYSDQDHKDNPRWELELSSQTCASGYVEISQAAHGPIKAGKEYILEFMIWTDGGLTGVSSVPRISCTSISGSNLSTGTYYDPNDTAHVGGAANSTWSAVHVTAPESGQTTNIKWTYARSINFDTSSCNMSYFSTTLQNYAGSCSGSAENVMRCNGSNWYCNSVNSSWGYASVTRALLIYFAPPEVFSSYHVVCRCTFNHQGYSMIDSGSSGHQWQWCNRTNTNTRYGLGTFMTGTSGTDTVLIGPLTSYSTVYIIACGSAVVSSASMMQGVAAQLNCIRLTTTLKPPWS